MLPTPLTFLAVWVASKLAPNLPPVLAINPALQVAMMTVVGVVISAVFAYITKKKETSSNIQDTPATALWSNWSGLFETSERIRKDLESSVITLRTDLQQVTQELQDTQRQLSSTQTQLNSTTKLLEQTQQTLAQTQQELTQYKVSVAEMKRQLDDQT